MPAFPPIPARFKTPFRRTPAARILAAFFLILLAAFVGQHLYLSARIRSELAKIRAAKEPVTLVELNSFYKAVPDSENAAKVYGEAFKSAKASNAYKFLLAPGELPQESNSLPEDLYQLMTNAVAVNQKTLETLRTVAKLKSCRYPVDYTPGWAALLPHLESIKACGRLEKYNGVLHEHAGQTDAAIQSVALILKYADSLNGEPDAISLLFQHRLDWEALELCRWIINNHSLSREQLAKLQEAFATTDTTNRMDEAMIGDRSSNLALFDYSIADMANVLSGDQNGTRSDRIALLFCRIIGQAKRDELAYLARLEEIREVGRQPYPARLDGFQELNSEIRKQSISRIYLVTGEMLPGAIKVFGKAAQHTARMRLIQTALSIEQFRLKHGKPPATLQELCPDYLAQVPEDPFDGEQLRYSKNDHGYLLYSIGPDRKDNKGLVRLPMSSKPPNEFGDIVLSISR